MRILVLLLVSFSLTLKAQNNIKAVFEIEGKIADSITGKPMDYITVSLKSGELPVKTLLTRSDGSFVFSNLQPADYSLSIVSLGYTSKQIAISISDTLQKGRNFGVIYIRRSENQLNEVSITAAKPLVKQEVDRLTYDLQADPESKVNNVLEMMRKVPLLTLDAEDNILLKGNSSFKILINGKPSSMMERNPKDILRSMPASSIEKIEVITTPPAKYDGEGLAGIINIITNKKLANGYNASLNVNERFPAGGPGVGGSFAVKTGKVGLSGNAGGNLYNSPLTNNWNTRSTLGENPTDLVQNGSHSSDSRNGYFGSELSLEIDTLNLISAQFNINGNRSESVTKQLSVLNGSDSLLQRYDLANNNKGNGSGLDLGLNYQLGFRSDKNRLLTFSFRYYEYSNDQSNQIDAFNSFNYANPDYQQNNNSTSSEQTFQIDYVHPVRRLNIEGGIKAILRTNKSDFQYHMFSESSGQFEIDHLQSNKFNNTQDVFGAYNTYQYNLKDWGFKAGIRIEQTNIDADFISTASQVERNYFNVIPSVSISRMFKDKSSLNFGYTTRMQRPSIYRLNPFIDRSNPNFETTGNPNLHPTIGNLFQLNYSKAKKGSLNLGLAYMFINDLIMPFSTFNSETNITRTTYGNTGKARLIGLEFNLNYPISAKWNYSLSGRINHGWVEGTINSVLVKNQGLMPGVYTSTSYRFEKGWRINASMNYNGRNISLQGRSNSFIGNSLSLSKNLLDDKFSLSVATNNPFTKYRSSINVTEGTGFTQESFNQSYLRSFTTSLNYKFGSLKEAIKKNKRGIRNDDVSGGGNL